MYELKIPKVRVGVLVGKKGETKKLIERSTKCRLEISKEGDVIIYGDGLDGFICEKIVKAIGRGFNPLVALNLMNEDYVLDVINIKDFTGNNAKKFKRIKARVIGSKGKARKIIERLTGCDFVIYGRTASLICKNEVVCIAREGVERLLSGSPHGNVYGFLERELKKLKKSV